MINPTLMAILFAAGLLAVGVVLRTRIRLFRKLYLPAAVLGGAVGLIGVQALTGRSIDPSNAWSTIARSTSAVWSTWPGTLIAVVFSGLLLERSQEAGLADALRRGLRSGILAWIIILGQLVIGIVVYLTAVWPHHSDVPATFSQLLEISWAGGHGSAAGMGTLYAQQGFAQGRDLAFFCATVGLIYGVLSGLVLVNVAIRKGWTRQGFAPQRDQNTASTVRSETPIAFGRIGNEVIEPMVLPILFLAAAFAAGVLLQRGFQSLASALLVSHDATVQTDAQNAVANVPLFLFTLLGGWIIRRAAEWMRITHLIDTPSIQRLVGVAMEFLIVAGIATMRIESLTTFGWPLLMLLGLAAVWSAVCLLVLARWLLPKEYWFELGLLNYGFSTANTPQGMMLLRIIDPELKSNATTDYAVAAPLSAPFIGGGIISFLVLPAALSRFGPAWVLVVLLTLITLLLFAGIRLNRRAYSGSR